MLLLHFNVLRTGNDSVLVLFPPRDWQCTLSTFPANTTSFLGPSVLIVRRRCSLPHFNVLRTGIDSVLHMVVTSHVLVSFGLVVRSGRARGLVICVLSKQGGAHGVAPCLF